MYAVLDIETTGGQYNKEGITEIAIHKFDGLDVIDSFVSLVNPEKEIQPYVVKLTGINNKMLRRAPKFFEVAKRIIEITQNCILVAHNANFDYRILRTEFKRLGYHFDIPTLCTIDLSKELIPDLESYSLGKLCRNIGIPVSDRHRANGDALATLKLLEILLQKDRDKNIVKQFVKTGNKRDLSKKLLTFLDDLPVETGVFYFHKYNGDIIYIGKAKNIKSIVNNLFLSSTDKSRAMLKEISSVTFELTGSELIAQIKFHEEIMANKPKYNKPNKIRVSSQKYSNKNMVLVDKGRNFSEKSVVLIENDQYMGYGFTNLEHQINNMEILKNLISFPQNTSNQNEIIVAYLQNNKIEKFIRF